MVFNRKEYMKAYRLKNKEKLKEKAKIYRLQNREKINNQMKRIIKKYRQNNKEKARKSGCIALWKQRGLIDDYESIYIKYIETKNCEWCKCELNKDTKTVKCMDHDHITHKFRRICCKSCNSSEPWDKVTKVSCETTI